MVIPSLKLLQVAACTDLAGFWTLKQIAGSPASLNDSLVCKNVRQNPTTPGRFQNFKIVWCCFGEVPWSLEIFRCCQTWFNMIDNESRCAQKCLLVIQYATDASCASQRPNKLSFAYCIMWINTCRMQNKSKQSNNIKKQWLEFGRDCSFHPSIFRTFRLPGAAGLYATGASERPATPKSRELMSSTFSTSSKCIRIILEALLQKPCIATLSYVGM